MLAACALLMAAVPAVAPVQVRAETAAAPTAAALAEALQIRDLVSILRDEGMSYAETLDEDLFPGRGGADWVRQAGMVYDLDAMQDRFMGVFDAEMAKDPEALAGALDFFGSDSGQRILTLEMEARRALLDKSVEDAARARVEEMRAEDDPRMATLDRFVTANDLIEANVQGALNANLAFYRGMVEAGGMGEAVDEGQMLSDVWSQEEDVREETRVWLYAYLAMAYDPLSDDELDAYIAYSESPQGQRLNAALFAAFDAVFVQVSRDLGRAAALQMMGQDI
jgi:hypothetical protein